MNGRPGCIAPSSSRPIPAMPRGKPAGVPCVQRDAAGRCRLSGDPRRPAGCASLRPAPEMCGNNRDRALRWLARLEAFTATTVV